MLARARVGGWREGRRSRTAAEIALECVCRFALVAGWRCGLDAHDQGGVFDGDGAGADEMSELVDAEGCGFWWFLFRRWCWRWWVAAR